MTRRTVIIGLSGIVLVLAVGFVAWILYGAGHGNGGLSYDYLPPEIRAARPRVVAILAKETSPESLTAEDWADTKAMMAGPGWKLRMKGLTILPIFKGTAYAPEAWQLALDHLTDPDPVPRSYAADAVAILRPEEAARHIAPLLQDPDKETRDAVKRILSRLGYSTK
jgi:HEAT repeat protein